MKSSNQMTQEEANQKFHEWGVLLLLDVPSGIEFGIDNTSWKVGDKFKGVKLIPPGPHFVHYSLKSEEHKFKLGFFIHIGKKKRVWVRKWNTEKEDFLCLPTQEEEDRLIMGVNSYQFDEFLGPYPLERLQIWQECSNYINESVLDVLNPIERKVHFIDEEYKNQNYTSTQQQDKIDSLVMEFIASSANEQQNIQQEQNLKEQIPKNSNQYQNMEEKLENIKEQNQNEKAQENHEQMIYDDSKMQIEKEDCKKNNRPMSEIKKEIIADGAKEDFRVMAGTIYYTDLPKVRSQYGKVGEQITSLNLDKTPILKDYIQNKQKQSLEALSKKKGNLSESEKQQIEEKEKYFIFGEFQYAFVMLLLAGDFESFEHWKNIFTILTCSDKYMDEHPEFFIEFIPVLYNILKQFPRDFFIDSISKDNFLKTILSDFIEVTSTSTNKKLVQRSKRLEMLLEEYFLFFPKKNLIQNTDGVYQFDHDDDQDAPQIVDEEHTEYF